jgi:hypothetical protein
VYEECETLLGANAAGVLMRLQNVRPVRAAPHVDSAIAEDSARLALKNAGYNLEF